MECDVFCNSSVANKCVLFTCFLLYRFVLVVQKEVCISPGTTSVLCVVGMTLIFLCLISTHPGRLCGVLMISPLMFCWQGCVSRVLFRGRFFGFAWKNVYNFWMIFLTLPQMYSISQDVWCLPLASLVLEADVASMKECKVMNCNFSSWGFPLEFDSLVWSWSSTTSWLATVELVPTLNHGGRMRHGAQLEQCNF